MKITMQYSDNMMKHKTHVTKCSDFSHRLSIDLSTLKKENVPIINVITNNPSCTYIPK